jgi:hypothetical protein
VASHLQKYRLYLKRLQGAGNGKGGVGNGGSPGFMTGLAAQLDQNGGMVVGPGGPVGSPALAMNGGGNGDLRVIGNMDNGMGGQMHHLPNGVQMGGMMYQMNHNGMIPIPGVHSGPGGSIVVETDGNTFERTPSGEPYPTMLPPMMMNGGGNGTTHPPNGGMHGNPHGMSHNGMHHLGSNGQMHGGGGIVMGPPGVNGYPQHFNAGGVMYTGGNGMLMQSAGDGNDLSFDKKGQGIGDLGDDAVLDMFLKDGLPEGDGF